ncbi:hypothetical protein BS78_04G220100 [Paspalum vaginatum]|nr:hypothetical protein BS78_04G220100 [Paspalum vaginatum]
MELGMRLRCCLACQLPPNTNQPPPRASRGGPRLPGDHLHRQQQQHTWADKFFQVEMTVRDCDLDQYGVVNSAAYADYIDKAREELASSLGMDRGSIARTGNAMALCELNFNYFSPLKRSARFVVMVRVVQMKSGRMIVQRVVQTLPEHKLVLEATGTVICLNKDYRPTRVVMSSTSQKV